MQLTRWRVWTGAAAGVGASLCFHLLLTLHALGQDQPDLRHAGVFFSLTAIVLCNTLVLVGLLKILFPTEVSWAVFAQRGWSDTRWIFERVWAMLNAGSRWAAERGTTVG
jgi:hypothetical protein